MNIWRKIMMAAMGALTLAAPLPIAAQVQAVDPDKAIDGDLAPAAKAAVKPAAPAAPASPDPAVAAEPVATPSEPVGAEEAAKQASSAPTEAVQEGATYKQDDLIGAAEGVFGKGAQGLAGVIEDLLKKQGEPNAYIVGREGGGAFVVGLRYGSGTLHHKIEGQRPVYWTGPSIGFDAGANAGNTFVLVYNLYDSQDLYKRFPAGEGQAYLVGGFNASYMRRGDVVLIPIRVVPGCGLGSMPAI
jgi:hypothetical protein